MNVMGKIFLQRKLLNATSGQIIKVQKQVQNEIGSLLSKEGKAVYNHSLRGANAARQEILKDTFNSATGQLKYAGRKNALESIQIVGDKNITLKATKKSMIDYTLYYLKCMFGEESFNKKGLEALKNLGL